MTRKFVLAATVFLGTMAFVAGCDNEETEEPQPENPVAQQGYRLKGVIGSDSVDVEEWGAASYGKSHVVVTVKESSIPGIERERTLQWDLTVNHGDNRQTTLHLFMTEPRKGLTSIWDTPARIGEPAYGFNVFSMVEEEPGRSVVFVPTLQSPLRIDKDRAEFVENADKVERGGETVTLYTNAYVMDGTLYGTMVNQDDTTDSLAVDLHFSLMSLYL